MYNFLTVMKIATITSKRQLTIPASFFGRLALKKGQKVIVSQEDNFIKIEPALSLVECLAGSVKKPTRFKRMSLNKIIDKAKKEYFGGED